MHMWSTWGIFFLPKAISHPCTCEVHGESSSYLRQSPTHAHVKYMGNLLPTSGNLPPMHMWSTCGIFFLPKAISHPCTCEVHGESSSYLRQSPTHAHVKYMRNLLPTSGNLPPIHMWSTCGIFFLPQAISHPYICEVHAESSSYLRQSPTHTYVKYMRNLLPTSGNLPPMHMWSTGGIFFLPQAHVKYMRNLLLTSGNLPPMHMLSTGGIFFLPQAISHPYTCEVHAESSSYLRQSSTHAHVKYMQNLLPTSGNLPPMHMWSTCGIFFLPQAISHPCTCEVQAESSSYLRQSPTHTHVKYMRNLLPTSGNLPPMHMWSTCGIFFLPQAISHPYTCEVQAESSSYLRQSPTHTHVKYMPNLLPTSGNLPPMHMWSTCGIFFLPQAISHPCTCEVHAESSSYLRQSPTHTHVKYMRNLLPTSGNLPPMHMWSTGGIFFLPQTGIFAEWASFASHQRSRGQLHSDQQVTKASSEQLYYGPCSDKSSHIVCPLRKK